MPDVSRSPSLRIASAEDALNGQRLTPSDTQRLSLNLWTAAKMKSFFLVRGRGGEEEAENFDEVRQGLKVGIKETFHCTVQVLSCTKYGSNLRLRLGEIERRLFNIPWTTACCWCCCWRRKSTQTHWRTENTRLFFSSSSSFLSFTLLGLTILSASTCTFCYHWIVQQ